MKTMYYSLVAQRVTRFFTLILLALAFVVTAIGNLSAQGCTFSCPNPDHPLQVTLSNNCEDSLDAAEIGLIPGSDCVGPYVVEIMDADGNSYGGTIDSSMIGEFFMVIISSTAPEDAGQNCMFTIQVIDKTLPEVVCPPDTIVPCATPLDSVPGITQEDVIDCQDVEIQWYEELDTEGTCQDSILSTYIRYYAVIDDDGNVASCTQRISLRKADLADVEFPGDLKGDDALVCFPPPDTTPAGTGGPSIDGFPIENGVACNILVSKSDQIVPICSGSYKIIRKWTVMDWCTNVSTMTVQTIEVKDTTGPEVDAEDLLEVPAGPGCVADVLLPPADISDDCSDTWTVRVQGPFGTIEQNGAFVPGLPAGQHEIIYIATNDCGLVGRDTLILVISDQSTPSAVCNQTVSVPLNDMGMSITPAEAFDAGSFDNCGGTWYKAKRMTAPNGYDCFAGSNENYQFNDVVKFCCEDVDNGPIMVIMRVYDVPVIPGIVSDDYLEGHYTDCMVTVEVQDKQEPSVTCPSDITISCEYDFDPNNLEVFGSVVDDPADREEICIDDPGDGQDGLTCLGLDGLATDNCDVTIEENRSMIMDSLCGTGQIIRTFTVTDPGGRTASCQQVITIVNYDPFDEGDITWPLDYTTEDICDIDALDPEDLPAPFDMPVLASDDCDLATFNYEDEIFDFSGSSEACFKIIRTWTVIDWCQLNATGGAEGKWTHLQQIKVKNTVPPFFTSSGEDMQLCSDDPGCGDATAILEAVADDDCTNPETFRWRISIDENNDGTIDDFILPNIGSSVSESYAFPIGTHRVLYAVQDFCSNTAVEEQFITVESCAGPSAKCKDITTTLMAVDSDNDGETDGGMVTIWASDLDAGSDHPCGIDVTVAFSEDPNDTNLDFTCADLGDNEVELYVIDENGRTDFCTVTVTIQDNGNVCPDNEGITATIAGEIRTSSVLDMDDVMVQLHGGNVAPQYTEDGHYEFPPMGLGGSYEIEPVLNSDPTNGISTIDLIQIQKHLLGIKPLDSPYKIIAADANNSGSVSAVDILELKKLILGVSSELPNNTSWRFVDKAYQFIDPANPLGETFPESYVVDPLTGDMAVDFIGIKVGDVNESAVAISGGGVAETDLQAMPTETALKLEDVYLQAGEMREIQLNAADLGEVAAMQFTLEWDRTRIDVMEVIPGPRARKEQWNDRMIDNGVLPFSWHTLETGPAETDHVVTLVVRSIRSGHLSEAIAMTSSVTAEEALTESGVLARPHLDFESTDASTAGKLTLHQNRPNPFNRATVISYEIDEPGEVELLIYDVLGKVHYRDKAQATTGYNEFTIPASEIGATGLLVYTLKANGVQQSRRMIIEKK